MSDGVQPFALDKSGQALFEPFMGPVIRYLQQTAEEPAAPPYRPRWAIRVPVKSPRR
ncbi:Uncharacterised protein [Serratia fonticola]|uniref:Uncharacterized protein n=1 Tax=Serratia fonticola TaxID=47917 RepID=A0A4U9TZE6_SERFO|nr:Uncharacterised protein [Serratia fonticola]